MPRLDPALEGVGEPADARVDHRVHAEQPRVAQRQRVVDRDVALHARVRVPEHANCQPKARSVAAKICRSRAAQRRTWYPCCGARLDIRHTQRRQRSANVLNQLRTRIHRNLRNRGMLSSSHENLLLARYDMGGACLNAWRRRDAHVHVAILSPEAIHARAENVQLRIGRDNPAPQRPLALVRT